MTVASLLESFLSGTVALVAGIEGSLSSPEIRRVYFRFALHFLVITLVGYAAVSGILLGAALLLSVALLGPAGVVAFVAIASAAACYVAVATLATLWREGRLPTEILTGPFGLLRPLTSASQLSFVLSSLLIPLGSVGFMLEGIDVVARRNGHSDGKAVRSGRRKSTVREHLRFLFSNLALRVGLRYAAFGITLGRWPGAVDPTVSAFLIGCQLSSVYALRIRGTSFPSHLAWCGRNAPRILGFSLPLYLLQDNFGWVGTFLSLGISYSASAALVEPLILDDIRREV